MAVNKVVYGNTTVIDITDTTAIASDVAQGKYFYTADGVKTAGTSSGGGGGGASNYVTGTFTGTTTAAQLEFDVPYTGNGYPIMIAIAPTNGIASPPFGSLIQRYATATWFCYKRQTGVEPTYSSSAAENLASVNVVYKNSTTDPDTYNRSESYKVNVFTNTISGQTSVYNVKYHSNHKLSVYIAGTSYGFAANIEYTYHIIYSE